MAHHFVAVSTALDKVAAFGIDPDNAESPIVTGLPASPVAAVGALSFNADDAAELRAVGISEDELAPLREPGALTAALNWYRAMTREFGDLGPVTVPTTFVWGNRDPALGRTAAEETEVYVHAPYEFIELDAGHWLMETHPDVVADVVLERIGSGRDEALAD